MAGFPLPTARFPWWQLSGKWHPLSPPGEESQDVNPLHGSKSPRKTQFMQELDGTTFPSNREEKKQDQLQCLHIGAPMASGSRPAADAGWWSAYTLLLLQEKDPIPSSPVMATVEELTRCHMTHRLTQNKRRTFESKTGKDISAQGNRPSTGWEGFLFS